MCHVIVIVKMGFISFYPFFTLFVFDSVMQFQFIIKYFNSIKLFFWIGPNTAQTVIASTTKSYINRYTKASTSIQRSTATIEKSI